VVYRQTARSERVRAESRGRILRTARRLFARQGYDATTMKAVAVGARTSVGNLYFYFRNKEEILAELLREALHLAWEFGDTVAETVPVGPARLAVMLLCNFEGFLERDRDLIQLLAEGTRHKYLADWILDLSRERWLRYVSANAPAMPEGERHLAMVAWRGASRACIEAKLLGEITASSEEVAAFVLGWNLRGMGLTTPDIAEALVVARAAIAAARANRSHAPAAEAAP
jgi:AcrR family transcriptional regulator